MPKTVPIRVRKETRDRLHSGGRLDPYVARVLSEEPVEIQRTVIPLLIIFKSIARR